MGGNDNQNVSDSNTLCFSLFQKYSCRLTPAIVLRLFLLHQISLQIFNLLFFFFSPVAVTKGTDSSLSELSSQKWIQNNNKKRFVVFSGEGERMQKY